MMILIIAMLKTSFVLIAFIAFVRIIDLLPIWAFTALFLFVASIPLVMMITLELLRGLSPQPFSPRHLAQFGLAALPILVVLPLVWIARPAAQASAVSPFGPHSIRWTRREVLIDLAIVVGLLIACFAQVNEILLLLLFVPAFAALIANSVIHNRLRKRAEETTTHQTSTN